MRAATPDRLAKVPTVWRAPPLTIFARTLKLTINTRLWVYGQMSYAAVDASALLLNGRVLARFAKRAGRTCSIAWTRRGSCQGDAKWPLQGRSNSPRPIIQENYDLYIAILAYAACYGHIIQNTSLLVRSGQSNWIELN